MTYEELLKRDGRLVCTNKGVSMMPLLRADRDIMVIEACTGEQIKKYDAVLFVRPGRPGVSKHAYVLHRVLRVNPDGTFWIVGDNCYAGETVGPGQILGRLQAVVRDGRRIEVTERRYRCYVYLWCAPWPVRFVLLRGKAFLRKCFRFVKRITVGQ